MADQVTDIPAALRALALPTTCPSCGTGTPDPCRPGGVHLARIIQALVERQAVSTDQREKARNAELISRLRRNAAGTVLTAWEWEAIVAGPRRAITWRQTLKIPHHTTGGTR